MSGKGKKRQRDRRLERRGYDCGEENFFLLSAVFFCVLDQKARLLGIIEKVVMSGGARGKETFRLAGANDCDLCNVIWRAVWGRVYQTCLGSWYLHLSFKATIIQLDVTYFSRTKFYHVPRLPNNPQSFPYRTPEQQNVEHALPANATVIPVSR